MKYLYYTLIGFGVLNTIPAYCANDHQLMREVFKDREVCKLVDKIKNTSLEDRKFEEVFKEYDKLPFENQYRLCKRDESVEEKIEEYKSLLRTRIDNKLLFEELNNLKSECQYGKIMLMLKNKRFEHICSIDSYTGFVKLYDKMKEGGLFNEADAIDDYELQYNDCKQFLTKVEEAAKNLDNFDIKGDSSIVKVMQEYKDDLFEARTKRWGNKITKVKYTYKVKYKAEEEYEEYEKDVDAVDTCNRYSWVDVLKNFMKKKDKKEMLDRYVKRCDISQKLFDSSRLMHENKMTPEEYVKLYEEYEKLTSELGLECSNRYEETYKKLKKELENNSTEYSNN